MAKKVTKPKVKFKGQKPEGATLKAIVSHPVTGKKIAFPHRHSAVISTGVEATVQDGYRLRFALVRELAERGMVLADANLPHYRGPVSVVLLNCGREIVELKDGDTLVHVFLEADPDFDWEEDK